MEKERLEKVQRLFELYLRNKVFVDLFRRYDNTDKFPPLHDFVSVWEKEGDEYWKLHSELYPEPPKDVFEDVKKRTEKMKNIKMRRWFVTNKGKGIIKKGFLARIFSLIK